MTSSLVRRADDRVNWVSSIPFLLFHLVPLLAIVTGVTFRAVVLAVVLYSVRMLAVTAGYHRYFAHRSYRVSRPLQFALGFVGTTAAQKGPLWWAAHHRAHHRFADTDDDIHSPQKGFWWSHVGWILCDRYSATDLTAVPDLARHRELRLLDRHNAVGPWILGLLCFLVGGWSGLVVGFFASTVVLWHATFTINSLSHTFGSRRYATADTSRNNALLALLTFGEGWHNNHHEHPTSARQGLYWWEIDISWYCLRALGAVGLVHDLRRPSADALLRNRVTDAFDLGMFRAAWRRAELAVARSRGALGVDDAALRAKRADVERAVTAAIEAAEDFTRAARRRARGIAVDLTPSVHNLDHSPTVRSGPPPGTS